MLSPKRGARKRKRAFETPKEQLLVRCVLDQHSLAASSPSCRPVCRLFTLLPSFSQTQTSLSSRSCAEFGDSSTSSPSPSPMSSQVGHTGHNAHASFPWVYPHDVSLSRAWRTGLTHVGDHDLQHGTTTLEARGSGRLPLPTAPSAPAVL